MRNVLLLTLLATIIITGCNKQQNPPDTTNTPNGNGSNPRQPLTNPSNITVLLNDSAIKVTHIDYNRSSASFNFIAGNSLKQVDVKCFWFYQQNWGNYQYSDSINYSWRTDSLLPWHTIRAINYGNVSFDCCMAPLTDSLVSGNYSGQLSSGKSNLTVSGTFRLLFK